MTRLVKVFVPWELSPIQLISIQAFFVGACSVIYLALSHAFFLTHFGANDLPMVLIGAALIVPVTTFLNHWLITRIDPKQLLQTILYALLALLIGSWIAGFLFRSSGFAFVLMLGVFFFNTSLLFVQSVITRSFFDNRELKENTISFVTAAVAGTLILGLTIRPWVLLLGNPIHLLFLGALFLIGSIAFTSLSFEQVAIIEPSENQQTLRTVGRQIAQIMRHRLFQSAFAYRAISAFAGGLLLFIFLAQTERFIQNSPNVLAPFFANFFAMAQVVAAAILLFVVMPLLKRIGLSFGLITNPLLNLIFVILLLLIALFLPSQLGLFFWIATMAMGANLIAAYSTTEPTLQSMFEIIPQADLRASRLTLDGLSTPLGLALAGLVLLAINQLPNGNATATIGTLLIASIAWAFTARSTFNTYRQTLQERLNRRMLDEVDLSLGNAEAVKQVESLIGTGNPPLIRLALNLLQNDNHPSYQSRLIGLLNFRNENILSDVLNRIEEERLDQLFITMSKLFERHHSSRIKGHILRVLSACNPIESSDFVQEYLDDPDPEIKKGSMVGLLKYGGIPGSVHAGMRLIEYEGSMMPEDQLYTASILKDVGASTYYQPILKQLTSPVHAVRNGALDAATQVINPHLIDEIIQNLSDKNTRSAAMTALLAHGDHLPQSADDLLAGQSTHSIDKHVIARIARGLGQLKTDASQKVLEKHINHPDVVIRSAVLNALRSSQFSATSADERKAVNDQIDAELRDLAQLRTAQKDIGSGSAMARLIGALDIEANYLLERLFNLMSFIYDRSTIWTAYQHIQSKIDQERDLAQDTLDVLLSDKHKQVIAAVTSGSVDWEDQLSILDRWVDVPFSQSLEARMRELINSEHTRGWTKASAIYSAAQSQLIYLKSDIKRAISNQHPLVSETALWASDILNGEERSNKPMLTIEKVAILKAASIFKDTPDNVLASVATIVQEIPLEANETFIKQGDSAKEMYLVVEGEVEALINGKSIIKLGQGQTVGELAIFTQEPRSADVKTLGPTLLFSIEREALTELMADRPEIAQGVIGALSRRIREQGQLMSQAS
ncbi:MAG: cyclic nucleotide-binding domain-containing protein [Chloroflexota bacterium]